MKKDFDIIVVSQKLMKKTTVIDAGAHQKCIKYKMIFLHFLFFARSVEKSL